LYPSESEKKCDRKPNKKYRPDNIGNYNVGQVHPPKQQGVFGFRHPVFPGITQKPPQISGQKEE
jgi:hypothetical protein